MKRHNEQHKTRLARSVCSTVTIALLLLAGGVSAAPTSGEPAGTQHAGDPHYTPAGFFDIHVCNWPDRKLFFMSLFSTTRYREIKSIEVRMPDGGTLTNIGLAKYRLVKTKDKPEKHVFMTQTDVPDGAPDGWYSATVTLTDGTQIMARDYVVVARLPRPSGLNPPDGAEQIPTPEKLTWSPVDQAGWYQVYILDNWNDGKVIYTSKLLREPVLVLPPGLLQADGLYTWKVHARDINEDKQLGDFNKGSMSSVATFSTAAQ